MMGRACLRKQSSELELSRLEEQGYLNPEELISQNCVPHIRQPNLDSIFTAGFWSWFDLIFHFNVLIISFWI